MRTSMIVDRSEVCVICSAPKGLLLVRMRCEPTLPFIWHQNASKTFAILSPIGRGGEGLIMGLFEARVSE